MVRHPTLVIPVQYQITSTFIIFVYKTTPPSLDVLAALHHKNHGCAPAIAAEDHQGTTEGAVKRGTPELPPVLAQQGKCDQGALSRGKQKM